MIILDMVKGGGTADSFLKQISDLEISINSCKV